MNAYILVKKMQNYVTEVISMLWKTKYKRNAANNKPRTVHVIHVCALLFLVYVLSKVATDVNKIHG